MRYDPGMLKGAICEEVDLFHFGRDADPISLWEENSARYFSTDYCSYHRAFNENTQISATYLYTNRNSSNPHRNSASYTNHYTDTNTIISPSRARANWLRSRD